MRRIRAINESSFAVYEIGDVFEVEDKRIVYLKLRGYNILFPFSSTELVCSGLFERVEGVCII